MTVRATQMIMRWNETDGENITDYVIEIPEDKTPLDVAGWMVDQLRMAYGDGLSTSPDDPYKLTVRSIELHFAKGE